MTGIAWKHANHVVVYSSTKLQWWWWWWWVRRVNATFTLPPPHYKVAMYVCTSSVSFDTLTRVHSTHLQSAKMFGTAWGGSASTPSHYVTTCLFRAQPDFSTELGTSCTMDDVMQPFITHPSKDGLLLRSTSLICLSWGRRRGVSEDIEKLLCWQFQYNATTVLAPSLYSSLGVISWWGECRFCSYLSVVIQSAVSPQRTDMSVRKALYPNIVCIMLEHLRSYCT